jgi:hypothetical protein
MAITAAASRPSRQGIDNSDPAPAYKFTEWSLRTLARFAAIPQSLYLSLQASATSPMDLAGVGYGTAYCDFLELEALVREIRKVLVNLWDKPSIKRRITLGEFLRSLSAAIAGKVDDILISDNPRHHRVSISAQGEYTHLQSILVCHLVICSEFSLFAEVRRHRLWSPATCGDHSEGAPPSFDPPSHSGSKPQLVCPREASSTAVVVRSLAGGELPCLVNLLTGQCPCGS